MPSYIGRKFQNNRDREKMLEDSREKKQVFHRHAHTRSLVVVFRLG